MLEGKFNKLKSKGRKMCVYDGYPKGIAEDCFGSHKEDKMFVKYNYKVLDDDYVNNLKELF